MFRNNFYPRLLLGALVLVVVLVAALVERLVVVGLHRWQLKQRQLEVKTVNLKMSKVRTFHLKMYLEVKKIFHLKMSLPVKAINLIQRCTRIEHPR